MSHPYEQYTIDNIMNELLPHSHLSLSWCRWDRRLEELVHAGAERTVRWSVPETHERKQANLDLRMTGCVTWPRPALASSSCLQNVCRPLCHVTRRPGTRFYLLVVTSLPPLQVLRQDVEKLLPHETCFVFVWLVVVFFFFLVSSSCLLASHHPEHAGNMRTDRLSMPSVPRWLHIFRQPWKEGQPRHMLEQRYRVDSPKHRDLCAVHELIRVIRMF